MDRTAGNPGRRAALLLAGTGIALLGVVAGGWMGVPGGGPSAVETASPALSSAVTPVALFVAAIVLFIAAGAIGRRARDSGTDQRLRDPATGLYRPAYVAETVANLAARDDRVGRSRLAIVLLEVAFLDDIERQCGRGTVDRLLTVVGRQIRGQTREGDLPMRDGDRFVVYLQCEEAEQAAAFCRRLVMLLSQEQIEVDGDVIKVALLTRALLREPNEAIDRLWPRLHEQAVSSPG